MSAYEACDALGTGSAGEEEGRAGRDARGKTEARSRQLQTTYFAFRRATVAVRGAREGLQLRSGLCFQTGCDVNRGADTGNAVVKGDAS